MTAMNDKSENEVSQPNAQAGSPTPDAGSVPQGETGAGLAPTPVSPCIYTRHTYHKIEVMSPREGDTAPRTRETQIDVLTVVAGQLPVGLSQFMGNVLVDTKLPTGETDSLRFQFPIEATTIEEAFAKQEESLAKARPGILAEIKAMKEEMVAQLRKPVIVGPGGPAGNPFGPGKGPLSLIR